MSRYINADKLKLEMHKTWDMQELYLPVHFESLVNEQPTADVVEAPVRCRDCEHVQIFEPHFVTTHTYGCKQLRIMMPPDGFCSYGERKEQDE